MAAARSPSDVRLIDWADKPDFYRVRGAWLEWTRWDSDLNATAQVCLAEIADRMAWDKSGSWPGQDLLAATLGCADKTIRNAIAKIFERGWLVARRGGFEEKRGYGKSYTYAMSASPAVIRHVIEGHQQRMADLQDDREIAQYRQKIAGMLIDAIPEECFLSYRKKMTGNTGKNLPLIPAKNDRLIYSENLSIESIHLTDEDKRLGETSQDESQGHALLPSKSQTPVLLDDDDADEQLRVEEEILAALGGGDLATGRRLALLLGPGRMSHLEQLAMVEGVGGAGEAIYAAAKVAWKLEADAQSKVTT